MNCADVRTLIGGYVLHALEPDEADAVRRHIADCPDCAREHADLAPVPALLDAAHDPDAEPAAPPPALEDAVLDRFARERGRGAPEAVIPAPGARPARRPRAPRWLARPLPAAALAAAAAIALTLGVTSALDGDGGDEGGPKVYGAHLRAAAGGAPDQGTDPAPTGGDRPYAYAKLSSTDIGTKVELKASGLSGAGAVYELWCVYPDGSKVSGGTFRADSTGHARATMTTAARVGDYHRLTVEQRLPGKRGERVLAGDIAY